MTLLDMATFIGGKVNQTEAEDIDACKGFLTRRHEMLWQEDLWKDSLAEYVKTIDPDADNYTPSSNYLPTKGVLLVPPAIERVLAVRTNERALNVQRPELFYRVDYDAFAKRGSALDFILLSPCVWEFDKDPTGATLGPRTLAVRAGADAELELVLDQLGVGDGINSDGVTVERRAVTLQQQYQGLGNLLLGATERFDAISKLASHQAVEIRTQGKTQIAHASGNPGQDIDVRISGEPLLHTSWALPSYTLSVFDVVMVTLAANAAYVAASPAGFVGELGGESHPSVEIGVNFGGSLQVAIDPGDRVFLTVGRNNPLVTSLAAAATNAPRRQRIRLVEIPDTTEITVRVLGKRSAPSFTADNDQPGITGCTNTLLAFAHGDMLQRERQYGKAQAMFTEGMALLDQLKRQETVQQAHNTQIIPASGYGGDYGGFVSKGNFFG